MFTDTEPSLAFGCDIRHWDVLEPCAKGVEYDLAIAINHSGGLEHFGCPRVCLQWVNSFEYLTEDQISAVDLWLSPSEPHRQMILDAKQQLAEGKSWTPLPEQWKVVPLGCYPDRYGNHAKVPGRVIYASSPDRGLHHLLRAWPSIKRQVPHAHLRIYYRIREWIDQMKQQAFYLPIEENRQRAIFIDEALRRLGDPKWDVEVVGPVSRVGIEQAMDEAECLAYPCDTLRWSEGFSCTTLEACAAKAEPVIWDCDALGDIYRQSIQVWPRGDLVSFVTGVVAALNGSLRHDDAAREFAESHTWKHTAKKILKAAGPLLTRAEPLTSDSTSTETTVAPSST